MWQFLPGSAPSRSSAGKYDGTTTATLLAHAILRDGMKSVAGAATTAGRLGALRCHPDSGVERGPHETIAATINPMESVAPAGGIHRGTAKTSLLAGCRR
jgi:hypothetical protein